VHERAGLVKGLLVGTTNVTTAKPIADASPTRIGKNPGKSENVTRLSSRMTVGDPFVARLESKAPERKPELS
jgi:hypothetical protein